MDKNFVIVAHHLELLVQPWQPMMAMFGTDTSDPLAGARAWYWLTLRVPMATIHG